MMYQSVLHEILLELPRIAGLHQREHQKQRALSFVSYHQLPPCPALHRAFTPLYACVKVQPTPFQLQIRVPSGRLQIAMNLCRT